MPIDSVVTCAVTCAFAVHAEVMASRDQGRLGPDWGGVNRGLVESLAHFHFDQEIGCGPKEAFGERPAETGGCPLQSGSRYVLGGGMTGVECDLGQHRKSVLEPPEHHPRHNR